MEAEYCEYIGDGEICTKHNNNTNLHYGSCIYCIMDGKLWEEEWDYWEEVSSRAVKITLMGYNDYRNGIQHIYTDDSNLKECIKAFRAYYRIGQKMAMGLNNTDGEINGKWEEDILVKSCKY